jgi:hypothetical protein
MEQITPSGGGPGVADFLLKYFMRFVLASTLKRPRGGSNLGSLCGRLLLLSVFH